MWGVISVAPSYNGEEVIMEPINTFTVADVIQARGLLGAGYARIWTTLGGARASKDTMRNAVAHTVRKLLDQGLVVRAGNQRVARFIHREAILEAATLLLGPEAMGRATRREQPALFPKVEPTPTQEVQETPQGVPDGLQVLSWSGDTPEDLPEGERLLEVSRGLQVAALSVGHDLTMGIVGLTVDAIQEDLETRGVALLPLQLVTKVETVTP